MFLRVWLRRKQQPKNIIIPIKNKKPKLSYPVWKSGGRKQTLLNLFYTYLHVLFLLFLNNICTINLLLCSLLLLTVLSPVSFSFIFRKTTKNKTYTTGLMYAAVFNLHLQKAIWSSMSAYIYVIRLTLRPTCWTLHVVLDVL